MIDYEGNDYTPEPTPAKPTPTRTPGLVERLEAMGFRPFTEEW